MYTIDNMSPYISRQHATKHPARGGAAEVNKQIPGTTADEPLVTQALIRKNTSTFELRPTSIDMPLPAQALLWDIKREALVPISIDIDVDGVRLIDSFTWDLHQGQVLYRIHAVAAFPIPCLSP